MDRAGERRRIGIWKLPAAKIAAYKKWRSDWLSEITKTREMDKSFKELIAKDRMYTCERHFASEDIEICKFFTLFWRGVSIVTALFT